MKSLHSSSPWQGQQFYPLTVDWLDCDRTLWQAGQRWLIKMGKDLCKMRFKETSRQDVVSLSSAVCCSKRQDQRGEGSGGWNPDWQHYHLLTFQPGWLIPHSHSRLQSNWIKTWWRMIQHCTDSNAFRLHTLRAFKNTTEGPLIAVLELLIVSQNVMEL